MGNINDCFSILSGSLHSLVLEAKTRGHLTRDLVVTLTHILDMYVLSWQQQEAAKKAKAEEEASLYRSVGFWLCLFSTQTYPVHKFKFKQAMNLSFDVQNLAFYAYI